jgi:hypothetical protein
MCAYLTHVCTLGVTLATYQVQLLKRAVKTARGYGAMLAQEENRSKASDNVSEHSTPRNTPASVSRRSHVSMRKASVYMCVFVYFHTHTHTHTHV